MKRIITTAMLVAAGISVSACNVSTGTALKVKEGDYNYAHYHNDDSDENNLSGSSAGATVTVAAASSGASSGGFAGTSTGGGASGENSSGGASGQSQGSSGGSGQASDKDGHIGERGKEADPSQPENGGSTSQPDRASQQDWAGEDRSATHNDSLDKDGAAAEQARNEQDKNGGVSGPVPSDFQTQGPEKDGPNPTHEPDKDGATSTGAATAGNVGTSDTTPTESDHLDKD